jgi:hypothetical protein
METRPRGLSASFSLVRGAMRLLKQRRSIDQQRALSPVDSVAMRSICGPAITIIRIGGLYEDRGTESMVVGDAPTSEDAYSLSRSTR